ncbi:MAG TPA: hypothetical protein VGM36_14715 [Rhizomicrobium sp.]
MTAPFYKNTNFLSIAVWLALSALMLTCFRATELLDTDSAMRLAGVRDLLNGQSWFDTTQWRMNTPYGLPMHWSRLIDGGIAALVLLFRPFMGDAAAQSVAINLWPLLPLLAALLALSRIAAKIGGWLAGLVVLVLTSLCFKVLSEFAPGSIDHHNVQFALTLWTIAFLCDAQDNARSGIAAALTSAVSLAIGLETLPYVATAIAIAAMLWIRQGETLTTFTRNYGLTIAAAALALLFGATAARYRFAPACDTYSLFYAIALFAGGAGLAAITFIPAFAHTQLRRALAIAALAALTVTLAGAAAPICLAGPYAQMDPRLQDIFLNRIYEASPAFTFARLALSEFIAGYIYALFGFAAAIFIVFTSPRDMRFAPSILCIFALAGLIVGTLEFRAVPFAMIAGLPAIAVFIVRVIISRMKSGLLAPFAALAAILFLSDAAFALAGGTLVEPNAHVVKRIAAYQDQLGCNSAEGLAPLAHLPKGRVAAFVDQGPSILINTPDAAVAGPYHRDASGILDTYRLFTGAPQDAASIIKTRNIDYVMICTAAPVWHWYQERGGKNALIARIAQNRLPAWLSTVGQDKTGHIRVYRVVKSRLD